MVYSTSLFGDGQGLRSRVAVMGVAFGISSVIAMAATASAGVQQSGMAFEGRIDLTIDGQSMSMAYWPHSVRSHVFRVRAQVEDGSLVDVDVAPPKTVRGTIEGLPGAIAAGSWLEGGLHAAVFMPDGRVLWFGPGSEDAGASSVEIDAADSILAVVGAHPSPHSGGNDGTMMLGFDCKVAQIAFDADFEMYQLHGSSEQQVVDRIEAILNAVNVQFENEVGIIHEITEIIVRTSAAQNPYTSTNNFALLNQFRNIWNSGPESDIIRDVAHLYTGKVLDASLNGAAFLGVVCNLANAYAVVRDQTIDFPCMTDIAARMLGANWNATLCECPGTTMHTMHSCANTFIGPGSDSVELILAYKDSVDCLESCVPKCVPADLNCDGSVGVEDLLILLASWGPCAECSDCPADLSGNCAVGVDDLLILLANWG